MTELREEVKKYIRRRNSRRKRKKVFVKDEPTVTLDHILREWKRDWEASR
jgi:hypothetical protein